MNPSGPPKEFVAPWQAEAYSIAQSLIEAGRIAPAEWSAAFGAALQAAAVRGEPDDNATYYAALADALGKVVVDRGLLEAAEIERRIHDWREAYLHTPHGRPVVLGAQRALER